MPIKNFFLSFMIFLFGQGIAWADSIRIVTTTEDLASIAREVGGASVHVESLTHGSQDPHFLEARPSLMLKASRADLFIQVGLGLEAGWVPAIQVGARNPKIQPGSPGFLDASSAVQVQEIPSIPVDRSHGDVHPEGNPHYWLDPENGIIIAEQVAEKLKGFLPNKKKEIEENKKRFVNRLDQAILRWETQMKPFHGTKVVTYHNSWVYFEKRFGLKVAGYIEPKPGISPSPSHIHDLISMMKKEKVKVIMMEPYFNRSVPELVSRETGAKLLVLPPSVGGIKGVESYIDLFDHNIGTLIKVLSEGS